MDLGSLIDVLEREPDKSAVARPGFHAPHSYRGYYERLAFVPVESATVGDMLAVAKSALGATYTGYKGGDYTMKAWTDVYLAHYGGCGDELSAMLLTFMLGRSPRIEPPQ